MRKPYKRLFEPIQINSLQVKNRIAYPSLALFYSYDRKLNDRYYAYFSEIAAGGAGIVTVGPVGVDWIGSGIFALSLDNDEAVPSFEKLAGKIRENGASPWVQLFHAGAYSTPILINNETPIAPSAVYSKYSKTTPREMTREDIRTVQESFCNAAARAREAGFEGVEIIGSAGYLICQFLSPLKNLREDEYGGSFENRTRFPAELITKMRERLGPDFPIGIRMAGNDFVQDSTTDAETPEIAKVYEKSGVDIINVTGGWHESKVPQLPMQLPRTGYSYLARNVKDAVSVPVIASNRITTPDDAEAVLRSNSADMVNLGRVLLADHEWPEKTLEGREKEIRPCVACSQGCTDALFSGRPVYCISNPRTGFELERVVEPAPNPKDVMIVGAGVAGLEAAVTAARRGHRVSLYETSGGIGGQIPIAAAPPHKKELLEYIRYYTAMLDKYDINLFLNTEMDVEKIRQKNPNALIVAQGAEPATPPIEGINDPTVVSSWDVLRDDPPLGREVAVIGGGSVGLETAHYIAAKGTIPPETLYFLFAYQAEPVERLRELMFKGSSNVTVFEMLPKAGGDVGKSTKWVLMGGLDMHGVTVNTGAKVVSVKDGTVTYDHDGTTREQTFDTVVTAAGSRSKNDLVTALTDAGIEFEAVGDCVNVGKIDNAIHNGFLAAAKI
jgi:2,4-dienoyl-CoA reductase (NADPH2)